MHAHARRATVGGYAFRTVEAQSLTTLVSDFAEELGLAEDKGGTFYGYYQDFPFACCMLAGSEPDLVPSRSYGSSAEFRPPERNGLLIQLRHVRADVPPSDDANDAPDATLADILGDGTLKIEVEDRITWVSVYAPAELLRTGRLCPLLDTVVAHLEAEGYDPLPGTCHYCMENSVESVIFEEFRVGQMCDACLAPHLAARQRQTAVTGRGLLLATASCIPGALLGAVVWAACWFLLLAIPNLFLRLTLSLAPILIVVAFVSAVGMGVASVATWYVRRVKGRGDLHACILGVAMAMLGIVLGEFLYEVIAIVWLKGVFSLRAASWVLAANWSQPSLFLILTRGSAAVISIIAAAKMARPKLERIPL